MSIFSWMAWTLPTALFFVGIALMLVAMTWGERRWPSIGRKGCLPMVTSRGDRLFVGLLLAAYINLAWAGATDLSQWYGCALSAAALAGIMKWA